MRQSKADHSQISEVGTKRENRIYSPIVRCPGSFRLDSLKGARLGAVTALLLHSYAHVPLLCRHLLDLIVAE